MVKPKALVDNLKCLACGGCISICPQDSIIWTGNKAFVNKETCISCSICIKTCPIGAITAEVY
jgi:NAD-dependent dihydropyrimidine dehydrogenase PreA subunit